MDPLTTEEVTKHRPSWLSEWQDYPHGSISETMARQLNKYCVLLEQAIRDRERERDELQRELDEIKNAMRPSRIKVCPCCGKPPMNCDCGYEGEKGLAVREGEGGTE